MREVVILNASVDKVYELLLDYLSKRSDVKIRQCAEPSFIESRLKSYFVVNPCDVKIELSPEKRKTSMKVTFDFTITYVLGFFLWMLMQTVLFAFFGLIDTIFIGSWTIALVLAFGLRLGVKRTKKNFMKAICYHGF